MFSQISAKGRLRSVPSEESEFTRSYTLEASCKSALRTSMDSLHGIGFRECGNAMCSAVERLAHASARCAAGYVVAVKRGVESDGYIKVRAKFGTELTQFLKCEIAKLDAFLESEANGVTDLFMCGAEWNALVHEIRGGGHGVEIAGLRCIVHALAIELKRRSETSDEGEHGRHKLNLECRLLGLLHVFIVGQRQAFELQSDSFRGAVDSSDFGADQLGQIGIFLLRHGARSGRKSLRQLNETELCCRKQRDLFCEPAEMQADKGQRL